MKKILVTGAAGFIGSHLAEELVKNGFSVRALVRYNSKNNFGWLENSPRKNDIEILTGDVRDYDCVYNAVRGCDTVFHLAALIGIPYSYVSPLAYIRTNIEGTYNIMQASKELNVENILVTSTSETYGTAQYVPIDEKHPLVGQSPYSASKIGADQIALSYFLSFSTPVKLVRPFNTYGPRQSARAVIPTVITQILSGKKEIKLGHTSPTRDLTFVKDTVNGFITIANTKSFTGQVTNIGMNNEISVGDLTNLIAEITGEKISIITDDTRVRPDKSEVERLWCDNKKIISAGWSPQYDLHKGLTETIEFLKSHLHLYKPEIYNV
jgi:NAD dependent epimerase/dehydratase